MATTSLGLSYKSISPPVLCRWDASLPHQQLCHVSTSSRPFSALPNFQYEQNKALCSANKPCNSFQNLQKPALSSPSCRCSSLGNCAAWPRYQRRRHARGQEAFKPIGMQQRRRERWSPPRAGINIDRRMHLEEAFKRQQEEEAREAEAEVTCPLDCVREIRSSAEFDRLLQEAERNNELVVMDFYNSACGSCKYIGRQFVKLCKSEACSVEGGMGGVIFAKHNVIDDYDDLTEMARLYSIKVVPMFSFFMDGCRVEQFPTRDRKKLEETLARLLSR